MTGQLFMRTCKKNLAILWFIIAGVIFFILIIQSFLGRYGGKSAEAWAWFLPSVMPTLSLIVGIFVLDSLDQNNERKPADRFMYSLAFFLSIGYLLILSLTIFLEPFSELPPLDLMKQSNLWLGPLQGLVTASLGAFFVKS